MTARTRPAVARTAAGFYPWFVLGILFLMLMLNQGDRAFFGNFIKPLEAQFQTNRAALSVAVTISSVMSGLALPLWGRVFDRFGPRAAIGPGSLCLIAAFGLLTTATEVWQLYLYYGVLAGIGLAGTGPSIGFAIAARWFRQRRSFAFGLLAAGGMTGSFVMVPGTMFLLLNAGAAAALLTIAGLSVIVAVPFLFGLIPEDPPTAQPASAADGPALEAKPLAERRIGIGEAIRMRSFWCLVIPSWASGLSGVFVQVHVIPMLTDRGFHPQVSANAVGLISGFGLLAVIGGSFLAPRWGERRVLSLIYFVRAIGFFLLAVAHDPILLYAAVFLIGISWGGIQPMVGGLTGDVFGRLSLATLLGWIFMSQNILGASAAVLGGWIYDLTGDYLVAIVITGVLLLIGVPMSLSVRPRGPAPAAISTRSPAG